MPNWVFNYLSVTGSPEQVTALKEQVNAPFTKTYKNPTFNKEKQVWEPNYQEVDYPAPVFSFWNIKRPENLSDYVTDEPFSPNGWYSWNTTNWGTKWDVSVGKNEDYPDTELLDETTLPDGRQVLVFKFNTAWSPPEPAILELSRQYPSLQLGLSYEEETGWGGEVLYQDGGSLSEMFYENRCSECEEYDSLTWDEEELVSRCGKCNASF